jgi:hypothetical protein
MEESDRVGKKNGRLPVAFTIAQLLPIIFSAY